MTAQPQPTTAPPPPASTAPGEPPPPRRRFRDRARSVPRAAWLSVAAVIVVVGAGLGGFFIGRASAPDGPGFPDRGQRPDFPGGGNGPMPGMPGMPGQGDRPGPAPGQPGAEDGTSEDGTSEGSADTTAWYVVPPAS